MVAYDLAKVNVRVRFSLPAPVLMKTQLSLKNNNAKKTVAKIHLVCYNHFLDADVAELV